MSEHDDKSPENLGFVQRWSARKKQRVDSVQTQAKNQSQTQPSDPLNKPLNREANKRLNTAQETFEKPTPIPTSAVESDAENDRQLDEQASAKAPLTDAEDSPPILCDDDMPQIETLTAKSDLSAFFNQGVSAGLRRAALRHVFQLPVYNERDGLNDYDDDFTRFEPLGDTITSDMKWHKARKEREAEEAEAERLAKEQLERQQATDEQQDADTEGDTQSVQSHEDQQDEVADTTAENQDNATQAGSETGEDADQPEGYDEENRCKENHFKDDELTGIPT